MALMKSIIVYHILCDELLEEIFLRLPTKSAVRLQVVCKRWYSLISSPYFISRFVHLRHHRDVQSSLVLQINDYSSGRNYSRFQIISDEGSLLHKVYLEHEFHLCFLRCSPIERHDLKLEGSFDDLILCSLPKQTSQVKYYVSNLLTKQWIALPLPLADEGYPIAVGFLCVLPPCSECKPVYSSNHKFTVVRLRNELVSPLKVQVFSSEDSQWRTFHVSCPPALNYPVTTSYVAYRGMLHWITADCIVVYDPLNTPETFSRIIDLPIQLPLHTDWLSWERFCLVVCQGRLRVVELSGEDNEHAILDVWELEDYDSGLWNLVHKVYLQNLTYNTVRIFVERFHELRVLSLNPENRDIVYLRIHNEVVSVNMKSGIVECYYTGKKNASLSSKVFHLSDQWWPTPVSSLQT